MAKIEEALPSQQFIEIEEVKQDTLILRNGGLRKILLVSGINFDLKSDDEKSLLILSFQNMLNGLNFSIQIFIHSRKINIEEYLAKLAQRQQEEPVELLKNIIGEYKEFISSFVSQNPIMEKTFFVVVPYDFVQIPKSGKKIFGDILKIFGKQKSEETNLSDVQKKFQEHLQQLNARVDQVVSGLNQIGLRAVALNDSEIIELFYNLYNPETTEKKL